MYTLRCSVRVDDGMHLGISVVSGIHRSVDADMYLGTSVVAGTQKCRFNHTWCIHRGVGISERVGI